MFERTRMLVARSLAEVVKAMVPYERPRAFQPPTVSVKMDPGGPASVKGKANRKQFDAFSYEEYAKEGYSKSGVAFACVDMLARTMAKIPLKLMKGGANEKGAEEIKDRNHPLLKLMRRPNPWQGGASFWSDVFRYYLIKGDTYVSGNGPSGQMTTDEPPTELWNYRPDWIKVIPSALGPVGAYELKPSYDAEPVSWNVDIVNGTSAMLHVKTFNPLDQWYGMSPLRAAALQVDSANAAAEWNFSILQNTGRPDGAFTYKPNEGDSPILTDKQRANLRDQMQKYMFGPKNARRPLILDGGIGWEGYGFTAQDLDWLEGQRDANRMICLVYGVPPQLLGIPGDNTYSNYEQARLALYEETAMPALDIFLDELNNWLVPRFGDDLYLCIDEDSISALAPRRKEKHDQVNGAVYLTINEMREQMNFEPLDLPEADEVYITSTMMPLSTALEPPAPEPGALGPDGKPLPAKLGPDGKPLKPGAPPPVKPPSAPAGKPGAGTSGSGKSAGADFDDASDRLQSTLKALNVALTKKG